MSFNYIRNGLNYNVTKEEYHHKVLKLTTPKIKKLTKRLNKLHAHYINHHYKRDDFIEYDIKHDILTSQIETLEKL